MPKPAINATDRTQKGLRTTFSASVPTVETKYRKIRPDEELWVIIDPGNSDVKGMLHANFGEEVYYPHSVRRLTPADYSREVQTYKHRPSAFVGSAIFEMDGQGYIIGKHAEQVGEGIRILGPEKYTREHLGALLVAMLLQLYPEGHDKVCLVITHPAKLTEDNMQDMLNSVKGRFSVKTADGRKVTYNITKRIPLEEPVASFQTFALTTTGVTYHRERLPLVAGMQFLVIDVGGWISHIVPGLVNDRGGIEINVSAATPIRAGIQNVMDVFENELKSAPKLKDKLRRFQSLPSNMLANALMSGQIVISNVDYDCQDQVNAAMQAIASPISTLYNSRFSGGIDFNGIVACGGGGGMSFSYLDEHVFNHGYTFTAEESLDYMRFGGVRGASKGLFPFLAIRG